MLISEKMDVMNISRFLLYKYDPPYLSPPYLIKDRKETDCSTPEETNIALTSSAGRDTEWYLSLWDEYSREELLQKDKRSGGKWLDEGLKGKPLENPIKDGNYSKFLYKLQFSTFHQARYAGVTV